MTESFWRQLFWDYYNIPWPFYMIRRGTMRDMWVGEVSFMQHGAKLAHLPLGRYIEMASPSLIKGARPFTFTSKAADTRTRLLVMDPDRRLGSADASGSYQYPFSQPLPTCSTFITDDHPLIHISQEERSVCLLRYRTFEHLITARRYV